MISAFIFGYIIASFVLCAFLIMMVVKTIRSEKSEIKSKMIPLFLFATLGVGSYTMFLLSYRYFPALIFTEIYFISTDWIALSMLNFSIAYTRDIKWKHLINVLFKSLATIDTVSLLLNSFTQHSFDLEPCLSVGKFIYWGHSFFSWHYIHLAFCYVMVALTFAILLTQSFIAKKYYRRKYIVILNLYFFVIALNFISYSYNYPVDISVIFYGILAFAINYYSNFSFPAFIVHSSLLRLIDVVSPIIVDFDYEGKVVYMNAAARNFFNVNFGVVKIGPSSFRKKYLANPQSEMDFMCDSQKRHFSVEYQELDFEGQIVGSYLKLEDKTEEIETMLHEKEIATHDELTGLYNRLGFFEAGQAAIRMKKFKNPILSVSNIKDFKLLNELLGEDFGDKVLIKQAALIKSIPARQIIGGRLGDDKFAVLIEKDDFNEKKFEQALKKVQKITENTAYQIFIVAGVYEVQDEKESLQLMYDKAKFAMDLIRDDYNDVFAYYDENLMKKVLFEREIVNDFDAALERGEFEVYLQPFEDSKGETVNVEALVRWNRHAQKTIWQPAEFLEILEKRGLLHKLDMYMCEKIAEKLAEWKRHGKTNVFVSVNISAKDRYYIDFEKFLSGLLDKYDFDANEMGFEIPEIMLIEQTDNTRKYFDDIRKKGFKIIIDGFGSDYSALNTLKNYNFDAIKLNPNFFAGIETSERNRVILSAIVKIASDFDLNIVAKGIEKIEDKECLKKFGLSTFQGFFYESPLSIKEFETKCLGL